VRLGRNNRKSVVRHQMAAHRKLDRRRDDLCADNPLGLMRPKGIREALSLGICEMGIGGPRLILSRCAAISGKRCRNRMKGRRPRNANIDLGLAILASTSEPPHTARTIAAYCGCSRQCIQQIEQKALRKLRAALYRNRTLSEGFENELQGLSKK